MTEKNLSNGPEGHVFCPVCGLPWAACICQYDPCDCDTCLGTGERRDLISGDWYTCEKCLGTGRDLDCEEDS